MLAGVVDSGPGSASNTNNWASTATNISRWLTAHAAAACLSVADANGAQTNPATFVNWDEWNAARTAFGRYVRSEAGRTVVNAWTAFNRRAWGPAPFSPVLSHKSLIMNSLGVPAQVRTCVKLAVHRIALVGCSCYPAWLPPRPSRTCTAGCRFRSSASRTSPRAQPSGGHASRTGVLPARFATTAVSS